MFKKFWGGCFTSASGLCLCFIWNTILQLKWHEFCI